jgi:hypothetical protein
MDSHRTEKAYANHTAGLIMGVSSDRQAGRLCRYQTYPTSWVDTVWHGWFRLQERLAGYELAKRSTAQEM